MTQLLNGSMRWRLPPAEAVRMGFNYSMLCAGMYLLKQVVDLAIKRYEQGFFFEPRQAGVGVHLRLYVQVRLQAEA